MLLKPKCLSTTRLLSAVSLNFYIVPLESTQKRIIVTKNFIFNSRKVKLTLHYQKIKDSLHHKMVYFSHLQVVNPYI